MKLAAAPGAVDIAGSSCLAGKRLELAYSQAGKHPLFLCKRLALFRLHSFAGEQHRLFMACSLLWSNDSLLPKELILRSGYSQMFFVASV